jgi:hypothetical protein
MKMELEISGEEDIPTSLREMLANSSNLDFFFEDDKKKPGFEETSIKKIHPLHSEKYQNFY